MLREPGIGLLYRIKLIEFDAYVSRAELPVHRAYLLVAVVLPKLYLLAEVLNGGNIVGQALTRQHTQFNLGNSEPVRVLRRVVDLQTIGQGFGL